MSETNEQGEGRGREGGDCASGEVDRTSPLTGLIQPIYEPYQPEEVIASLGRI